jgi:hypothetical protein
MGFVAQTQITVGGSRLVERMNLSAVPVLAEPETDANRCVESGGGEARESTATEPTKIRNSRGGAQTFWNEFPLAV